MHRLLWLLSPLSMAVILLFWGLKRGLLTLLWTAAQFVSRWILFYALTWAACWLWALQEGSPIRRAYFHATYAEWHLGRAALSFLAPMLPVARPRAGWDALFANVFAAQPHQQFSPWGFVIPGLPLLTLFALLFVVGFIRPQPSVT